MSDVASSSTRPDLSPQEVAQNIRKLVKFMAGGGIALMILLAFTMYVEPKSRLILQYAAPGFAIFVLGGCLLLWRNASQIEQGHIDVNAKPDPNAWSNQTLYIPKTMSILPPIFAISSILITSSQGSNIMLAVVLSALVALIAGLYINERRALANNEGIRDLNRYFAPRRGFVIEMAFMFVLTAAMLAGVLYAYQWSTING